METDEPRRYTRGGIGVCSVSLFLCCCAVCGVGGWCEVRRRRRTRTLLRTSAQLAGWRCLFLAFVAF
ncbi:hypothetical protein I7I53_10845 [Histoplasma capsulatum var. duboisii H88]|uniref:Uncharacterized protein n=1 Tax=Ajellomyces capsulatus (strain H88) TaxID=544711 RepID=A0A8A1L7Y8_AJEC8|nr:hypothetical protein I7I53_10845 [Histoplasma capsulatum var. duboisii H88]